MIKVVFFQKKSVITGFEVSGHSMSAQHGQDIICAFVSSACLMAANTVTEVIGLKAQSKMSDGYLKFAVTENEEKAGAVLSGLRLHLAELEKDYPKNIKVTISEV